MNHVLVNQKELICRHCGNRFELPLPLPTWAFVALMQAYIDMHEECLQEFNPILNMKGEVKDGGEPALGEA